MTQKVIRKPRAPMPLMFNRARRGGEILREGWFNCTKTQLRRWIKNNTRDDDTVRPTQRAALVAFR